MSASRDTIQNATRCHIIFLFFKKIKAFKKKIKKIVGVAGHPHLAWGGSATPKGQTGKTKKILFLPWGWFSHP